MTAKEISKYNAALRSVSVTCKCGRRVYVPRNRKFEICSWCQRKVLSKRENFKTKLEKLLEEQ